MRVRLDGRARLSLRSFVEHGMAAPIHWRWSGCLLSWLGEFPVTLIQAGQANAPAIWCFPTALAMAIALELITLN